MIKFKNMKSLPELLFYAFIMMAIAIVLYAIMNFQQPEPTRWQRLVHEEFGYAIDYPLKKDVIGIYNEYGYKGSSYLRARFLLVSSTTASIYIHQTTISDPSWEEVFLWGEQILLRVNRTNISSPISTTVGADNYISFRQTYQGSGSNLNSTIYYIIHNDNVIAISTEHCSVSKEWNIDPCKKMLNSLQLFDPIK
ncbi:MAG TPA: hypothetical protein VLL52_21555 [Anaerolineae bacterium]|nr:hypothetical protein [Anaerolineae bacterium]